MCGIFGYVGNKKNAAEIILKGLKTLEYRGYDSWGITVQQDNTLIVEKHIGKIGDAHTTLPESSIGIGHTRWATHGGVTVENAHPHTDCTKKVAILHNGIIENYEGIKKDLLAKGHTFLSETDTEVAAHLIEEHLATMSFEDAFRESFTMLKGLNAIVAVHAESGTIAAAKTGSPLIVGIAAQEYFIASDAAGIAEYTKEVLFIEDNHMVVINHGKLKLLELPNGTPIKPTIQTLTWNIEEAHKGNYEHFLLKEIADQPRVIENIALQSADDAKRLATLIEQSFGSFFVGCGTASYAALTGVYLFSRIAKKHINFSIASEFSYLEDYLTDKSLIIPISQSGETIDIVSAVSSAKKRKAQIAVITNAIGSTLYRQADHKFLLNAGPEKAVVSTKAFTAMVSLLLLSAYTLAGKTETGQSILQKAAENVETILEKDYVDKIKQLSEKIKTHEHVYIIGRGPSYPLALEASLKLKETCYIHAEGFAGGELKHGVIALIEKGTPCIVFAPNDETLDDILSNAQEIKARGAYVIGIGPKEASVFDSYFPTEDLQDATILPQVTIAQILAYHLALLRKCDPDKPRNLAKSVTVK